MDRKTIKVEEVVEYGNRMLLTVAGNRDFRRGVIEMIERVLFETGTYAGYNYQASEYLPVEERSGDNLLQGDFDETRRIYHV